MAVIVCKNVSKRYAKDHLALDKVNLSLDVKGIFSLIGRNGAGKTTLVRILSTTLLPSSGSATIDGVNVVNNAKKIRERIAVVPQEARPVGWMTPKEMITSYLMWRGFGYKEAIKKAEESLSLLGISKFSNNLNQRLSGGTKRKVLVATVIASDADIIFLDEPTTGLDPISRAELWNLLLKLKKTRFIFLTTHYLEEAEVLADKIGILENGRLLSVGSLHELRNKMGYPYSIKILGSAKKIKVRRGRVVKGRDGHTQIFTTEREARRIGSALIKKRVRFSINPVSLEDIFYYFAKKEVNEGGERDEEEY